MQALELAMAFGGGPYDLHVAEEFVLTTAEIFRARTNTKTEVVTTPITTLGLRPASGRHVAARGALALVR